ncbi:MAG: hypothetical protein ACRDUA_04985 [Micromonosporaceae bacterium]
MSTGRIPTLFQGLVDDAAVFPPGNAPLGDAIAAHRTHRASWYAPFVGPLLVRASQVAELPGDPGFGVGVIGDGGLDRLAAVLDGAVDVRQVEIAVAKRGEDPLPGLRALTAWAQERPVDVYAEIPLTWGCVAALDHLAEVGVAYPKFRTGGLAAELFPSPEDLAAVIVACAARGLRFKLTAGLHHAVRHQDPVTGFTHHGFLNVLVAASEAARGSGVATVAEALRVTEPEQVRLAVQQTSDAVPRPAGVVGRTGDTERPLWVGFGSCSIHEPLDDLVALHLITEETPA